MQRLCLPYSAVVCWFVGLFVGVFWHLNSIKDWKQFQATLNQPFDKGSVDEVSNFVPSSTYPLVVTRIIDFSAYEGAGHQLFCVAEGKLLRTPEHEVRQRP